MPDSTPVWSGFTKMPQSAPSDSPSRNVAAVHPRSEIAWIGPREFYERALGPMVTRRFAVVTRDTPHRRSTIPPAAR